MPAGPRIGKTSATLTTDRSTVNQGAAPAGPPGRDDGSGTPWGPGTGTDMLT
ncbi:hypothetical protein TPA0907_25170 [Micromonospora humidisoli]|nr:hypothetical protein TPA0907_25170 [Micromonospora sp. AKA109]